MGIFSRIFKRESAVDRSKWMQTTLRGACDIATTQRLSQLRTASRSFEAAETPAWTESWPTHASAINEDLARQLPTLRARSRGHARNNEWAIGYLIKLDDNVLGKAGIRLQMRLKNRDGSPDRETNDLIEGVFADFCKDADVAGHTWRAVETLALASLPTDGEILIRLRPGAGKYKIQVQLLDASLIDVTLHRVQGANRIRMGVEINDDGRPVAYWLKMTKTGDQPSDYVTVGQHTRIPAAEIIHCFASREIGQIRGYPWLSGGARRLWMLHDFEEAAAVASANAAKRQGFFYTPDGEAPSGFSDTIVSSMLEAAKASGKVLTAEEIQTITAAAEKYTTTMPGQYDTLPQGTLFQSNDSKWPDVSADGYVKQQLRGWSAARGISYVSLGNDLESVNYSSAQVGIVAERDHYESLQARLVEWLHARVFAAILPRLVLATPGLKPGLIESYIAAASWQPRRWKPLDPVKAANANETNLALRLTSRRRLQLADGEDPDEIAAEIAEEEKIYGPVQKANAPAQPVVDSAAEDSAETKTATFLA